MKIYISAQALQKHEMETRLAAFSGDIVTHLLKLYLMPNHSARNHWKQEVCAFLNEVVKLKGSKKYPTKEQIYKWTYDKVQDDVLDLDKMRRKLSGICEEYDIVPQDNVRNIMIDFDKQCVTYFRWLSAELSKYGYVAPKSVYSKLDELF